MNQQKHIDIDAFNSTPLEHDPYTHVVLPNFIPTSSANAIEKDFPHISRRGSFPLSAVKGGKSFNEFIEELFSSELKTAFENKYQINLSKAYPTITVRGHTSEKDGAVHTDSKSKILTILIYFNSDWDESKGRLRLLKSSDLEDIHTEISPVAGTLISFLNCDHAWHGHLPFTGARKAIQFNWVSSKLAANMVDYRHGISSFMKNLKPEILKKT